MATSLYHDVIFGPVQSRRLGLSLGVNLLPTDSKLCTFNCIYCECGWNVRGAKPRFNRREDVARLLREKLEEMKVEGRLPDVITFAGSGEPTMHPEFADIIGDAIKIRDELASATGISVLTNGTMTGRAAVRGALMRVDNAVVKLDSAFDDTVRLIDDPQGDYSVRRAVDNMKLMPGHVIVQTMFLRGEYGGRRVDNTTEREVAAWLELLREIGPRRVMIYTIDRDTPAENLEKVPVDELRAIAARVEALGIEVSVAG